jgi:hypothetical protein
MTAGPPPPDLGAERAQVLALVAGSALNQDPHLEAAAPLRSLPPAVEAKLANRAGGGGGGSGTPDVRRRVVVPCASLAVLDAIGVVAAAVAGHVALAIVAAVLFVGLTALAVLGLHYGGDANHLSARDRLVIAAAARWRSKQRWTAVPAGSRERGLVIAATRAAARIAGSPAWRSGRLDEQRVRLDLAGELDQIDEQAHRIATARAATGAVTEDPAVDRAWDAAVDRVAALTAYANELDGYARRRRDEQARLADPVRDTDLLTGSAQDELAFQQLYALTLFLTAQNPADG